MHSGGRLQRGYHHSSERPGAAKKGRASSCAADGSRRHALDASCSRIPEARIRGAGGPFAYCNGADALASSQFSTPGHINGTTVHQNASLGPTTPPMPVLAAPNGKATPFARSSPASRLAVDVRGLRISYGRGNNAVETLRGIDLSLPEGKIYGLLGPSGCGKTTLLRCIVGRLKPRHGSVRVFGHKPGQPESYIPGPGVGYMPQELTLYPEFSILETLTYFGRLFRIESRVLQERTAFLIRFLGLPEKSRLVKNLSGGQKRRVSLAAALIHRPPLLILDEPTVGVDPLLRQSIWHYLVTLTHREAISVIITTHYIEEARLANLVGLMRQGRILAQAVPEDLMQQHGMLTLEDVFLKLCMADNHHNVGQPQTAENGGVVVPAQTVETTATNGKGLVSMAASKETLAANSMTHLVRSTSLEQIPALELSEKHAVRKKEPFLDAWFRTWALVAKSLTRLHRNLPVLLFTFLVPSIQVVLFCLCIGSDPFELQVAVVNQETHPLLSVAFLQRIDNTTLSQIPYRELDAALDAVRAGSAWGAIAIGANFSAALHYRFFLGVNADNRTIEDSSINVYLDMTRVRPFEVILSHVICQFLVMFVQVAGLLVFTFIVFEIPSRGPFVWVVLLTLLQGCCGMIYGLVISSMCVEENSAIMLALGSFYPNLLLSGVVWPTQAMPYYMRYLSYGLPQTIPTESLRCILSRGWGIAHTEVWLGFVVSGAWCAVFLIFAAVAFRLRS
ncbi:hypothetical protein V5799_020336 [Amblyomma americanum]|uniref:ABC transporter domain-containing protein n=1 Tax=Amblyomma americanum TaxID=6943 RepID=A0AAQ4EUS7_AMBAM